MWIVQRYISREFIVYFLSCLLSLIFIAVVFAALSELKTLEKEDGQRLFLEAIRSGIPLLIEIITPISVLLATVLTFISLSKSSEIIAMMAAGISLQKMVFPIFIAGSLIGWFGYLNQSYLAPLWGADERTSMVDSTPVNNSWQFYQGRLFYFAHLMSKKQRVQSSRVFEFDDHHQIRRILTFEQLKNANGTWQAESGREINISQNRVVSKTRQTNVFPQEEFPVVFKRELNHPKYSDFSALMTEINLKRMGSVNFEADLFALYQKIAAILSVFVMILLALPFSLYTGKKSNVRMGIVLSMVMGFSFWLIDQIFISFNSAGLMPSELAAFGANILFTLLALLLIYLRRV
ncbi:MAG: LptF/LptG family permease [bacterium]